MARERRSIPQSEAPTINENLQAERQEKEREAAGLRPIDEMRIVKTGKNFSGKPEYKAVKAKDTWLEEYEPTEESEPVNFDTTESKTEQNDGIESFLDAKERINEVSTAVTKTAKGVLERLVPGAKSRVGTLEGMRKRLIDVADRSRGVLGEALRLAAERLGVVNKEAGQLNKRAEAANQDYQNSLEKLYSQETVPNGDQTLSELLDAYEALQEVPDAELDGVK